MQRLTKSNKLNGVCYDIRGPVLDHANRLEEDGHRILKLNIGNPGPFGFDAPDEIIADVIRNLRAAQGYTASKGLFPARKAIMQECQRLDIPDVDIEDIFLGNGVSELIVMACQALLNDNDQVLIPSPDYPLWTAAVNLAGGKAVHYVCDEQSNWFPDIEDIKAKITDKTRAIVVINPNNPTGAVYSEALLQEIVTLAEERGLVIFADEIYSKIIYQGANFIPLGRLVKDTLCVSFNGLSKAYRLAGFRSGWLVFSGAKHMAEEYIKGVEMLASMRLCANVPAMYAVQTALGGYQSINELILPGGRLLEQRNLAYDMLSAMPGISCVKPEGAIYMFPKIDQSVYRYQDDQQLILDFLIEQKVLLVQGSAFNFATPDHFRLVFLPVKEELKKALEKFELFLKKYRK